MEQDREWAEPNWNCPIVHSIRQLLVPLSVN
jgi:hypothetical protein